jgi:hypothetical protein
MAEEIAAPATTGFWSVGSFSSISGSVSACGADEAASAAGEIAIVEEFDGVDPSSLVVDSDWSWQPDTAIVMASANGKYLDTGIIPLGEDFNYRTLLAIVATPIQSTQV